MESIGQDDDSEEKYAEIAGVGLERCLVGKRISIDAVVCEPLIKAHVCDQDDVPSDETCDCRDMDEPIKDGTSVFINV